ncbi:MAG: hypothetical protein A3A30_03695 [Candidatus Terrybacteria bacterium RIFCSPLOWO2_01_FULL_48_14]|nr:MAG: hypothetical protein A3A30_03695 [Candidatus Terrybacteria bacterium RIFCSPLOWO2_01_FULL_48_14]
MRFEKTCRTPQRGVRTLARRCSPVYDSAIYLLKRGPCPQRLREAFLNTFLVLCCFSQRTPLFFVVYIQVFAERE